MSKNREPKAFWYAYFMLMIGILGGGILYCVALPLLLVGRVWKPAWRTGGKVLVFGVQCLLNAEPWLNAEVALELPRVGPGEMGYLTISNHRSTLDMYFLLAQIPNIRAVAKSALFKVPLLNVMMVGMQHIGIRPKDSQSYWAAMEKAETALRGGDPVHVFPEMTRCEPGFVGTQSFHLAPFHIAKRTNAMLIPIVFQDTDQVWPKGRFAIRYKTPCRVRSLSPIDPRQFDSAESLRLEVRDRIERALRSPGAFEGSC